jgi:hypothetical protein
VATKVSPRNVHSVTRIQRLRPSSWAISAAAKTIAMWSEAKPAMLCTPSAAFGSAMTSERCSTSASWRRATPVSGSDE